MLIKRANIIIPLLVGRQLTSKFGIKSGLGLGYDYTQVHCDGMLVFSGHLAQLLESYFPTELLWKVPFWLVSGQIKL